MAVQSLARFETAPGRLADHIAASDEAIGHLHRLGLQAYALQPLAGGDVGSLLVGVTYANYSDYAASAQKVLADDGWQEYWGRVTADPPAQQVESTLFVDLDPSFQPEPDRPLGAIAATQWRPYPGRMAEFVGQLETGMSHVKRMGGNPRALQSLYGAHPLTVIVGIGFADLDAWGAYADTSGGDQEFQAFFAEAMGDPAAELVRSGVYLNIS